MKRRTGLLVSLVAAGLVLGACGDDDDGGGGGASASGTTAAGGDVGAGEGGGSAYCDALVAFNGAVFAIDLDDTSPEADVKAAGAEIGPLWDDISANAPDEVGTEVGQLTPAIEALDEGDATAFNADASFETYTSLVNTSVGICEFPNTAVTARDYSFEGVPASLEAGTVAFTLTNEGEEDHELVIFERAEGDTRTVEEMLADPATEEEGPGEFVGATFAPPGGQAATFAELTAGDYVMVCFVPVGGAEDGPPHVMHGMHAEFTVE